MPDFYYCFAQNNKKVWAAGACPDGRLHHNTVHVVSSTHPSGVCIVLDCTSIIAHYIQLSRWCRRFSFIPQYIAFKILERHSLLLFKNFDIGTMAAAFGAGVATDAAALLMRMPNMLCCQIYSANNQQRYYPGSHCYTSFLLYINFYASTLKTFLPPFLAGRTKKYTKPTNSTAAAAVPALKASPPTNTRPS